MEVIPERALLSTSVTIGDLASLLVGDYFPKLLSSVEISEVENLHSSLVFLRLLLNGVRERSEHFTPLQSWLEQLESASDLAEDLASAYALKALRRRSQRGGLVNPFGQSTRLESRDLASEVEKVRASVFEIQETRRRYHPRSEDDRRARNSRRFVPRFDTPFLEELLVGIESARRDLVRILVGGGSGLSAISVVGAAGVGKTALAKIVFHDEAVARHFDFCSWVTVGRSSGAEEALTSDLRRNLRSKRCVLVLDDVWRDDFLEAVKRVLPENIDNGSRIIVTTRNENVPSRSGLSENHVHRLEPLSEAMSRDLLRKIAFQSEPRISPETEAVSEEFLEICEGSPLAIVTVAGRLLRASYTGEELRGLLESCFEVLSDQNVFEIMARSFEDLSCSLKLCFLSFAVFPRGSTIPYDKMFRVWLAEGFLEDEDDAEESLNELVRRNLVQACQGFYGLEKFCRVSVLMHEMARIQAEKLGFCSVVRDESSDSDSKASRISISRYAEERILSNYNGTRVRSVFLFDLLVPPSRAFADEIFNKFKLLKTLIFENVPIQVLPKGLGNLFYLKHLSLKNTLVKKLPKSIGNLVSLQTLDARNTLLTDLPVEIYKLRSLRHLLATRSEDKIRLYSSRGVKLRPGIWKLKSLQTLMTIEEHYNFAELSGLTELRRLEVSRLVAEEAGSRSSLCESIEKMTRLVHLTLHSRDGRESLDLLRSVAAPPPSLERLVLKGRLGDIPTWVSTLQNLTMVCLSFSGLVDDPLAHFSLLPSLVSLWLYRSFNGNRLRFEGGGFRALKLLVLRELPRLKAMEIEDGALPNLEELRIGPSPQLEELPCGIRGLSRLKSLALYDMPNKFVLDLQPGGGSEYEKVDRIESVQFWYRVEGRQYVWYELGQWGLEDHLRGGSGSERDDDQSLHMSFCYSDAETHSLASASSFRGNRTSFSSDRFSFFSDDIED